MSQVVVKGESVYECDECYRRIRVPTNRYGLDVMQRCNITQHCRGTLHKIKLTRDINSTPAFPPEISGVQDWFQRKILYTHEQSVQSKKWTVHHELGNKPVLHLYVNMIVDGIEQLVPVEPTNVTTVDLNTTELTFSVATSGLVQCVSLASANEINATNTEPTAPSVAPLQITNNSGEIAIATLVQDGLITLSVEYTTAAAQPIVDIDYVNIATTTALSPWGGVRYIVVNGRKYHVRSFNLATKANAAVVFEAGLVPSGSAFRISKVNGNNIKQHDVLILTAKSPFATVDRIYDQCVDAAMVTVSDPETYWQGGKAYCKLSAVKNVYPAILVV